VFDEGGSVLLGDVEFFERWRQSREPTELYPGSAGKVILFGHARMELVGYGRPEIRSCAVFLELDGEHEPETALDWVDRRVASRVLDPSRFTQPGADGVVRLDRDGRVWVGPPESAALARADVCVVRG
jgi:hypothetical protein